MIKNGLKFDHEQRKSDQLSDESIQLNVQPERKQMTTHTDFHIKYEQDERKIVLYIQLDPKNILNLTKQVNKGMIFDEDDRKRYKNCILIHKIQTPDTKLKGNFRIHFLHYKGLTFYVEFIKPSGRGEEQSQLPQVYSKMKIHYKNQEKWQTKWLNAEKGQQIQSLQYVFQLCASDVEKTLKQHLLLEIYFDKYPKLCKNYLGIQNEGNTCYANSTLQVLFHFMPLRKLILEIPSKKLKKLTKCLQEIFVDLMTSESSVKADQLLKLFLKIDDSPHRQQDIHQFLINFIQELQAQLPEVAQLWTGRDYEFTSSKEVDYQSKQQQNFTQLQLFMTDNKGCNLKTVEQSLHQLLQQDLADQPIDVDNFGKIKVYKSRQFETLPPLLFLNIKRYEYNPKRRELKKINQDMGYPKEMNLDFLMKTNQGLDYILYAVVVHKGRTPSSGHYFCFVNLSKTVEKSDWYEFNDSTVRKIKEQKVLNNYTGKKKKQMHLDEYYGKWVEKDEISQQTAYLLTYIHKDHFEEYQNLDVKVPTWQIERLQQKLTLQQSKTMISVRIFVLTTDPQFRPFQQSYQLQQFKFLKDGELEEQVKKLQKILSVKVGTIWKVNCKTQTIKHVHRDYGEQCRITVGRHMQQKQGVRQPDYFMIVPEEKMIQAGDYNHKKLGILHIEHICESESIESVDILTKDDIVARIEEMKSSGSNIEFDKDELQMFMYGWNSYLRVKKT